MGARPHRPAHSPAQQPDLNQPERLRCDRLHHRHRRPRDPHSVRWPRNGRLRRNRGWAEHERLQRPRNARRRHDRRLDLRRCPRSLAGRSPCTQLQRFGQHIGSDRRYRLGDGQPRRRRSSGSQHEPRWRPVGSAQHCHSERNRRRHHLRRCRRERERQCLQLFSCLDSKRANGRRDIIKRRSRLLLQLRKLR
ncbi:unannotated protein [freshwater metagenome]|uniref:Unannotated protein n=1 Tax=freshwater metagenome TaxID=449393 RepID=A0A6J5ZBU4_9ZZZZ